MRQLYVYQVAFTYGDHEMETDIFAAYSDNEDIARQYLLNVFTDDQGTGYMQDAIENPSLLVVEGVSRVDTVVDVDGNPYAVTIKQ